MTTIEINKRDLYLIVESLKLVDKVKFKPLIYSLSMYDKDLFKDLKSQ